MRDDRVWIGGVPVARLTAEQWCDLMLADWDRKKTRNVPPKVVTTVNGQVVSLFVEDPIYRQALLSTDYIAPDGMSVVFASRLATDAPLPERVATTDWFHAAAKTASRHGMKFYVLGATHEMNRRAVKRIRRLYPYLELVGARDGYFDRSDLGDVAADIRARKPDVLWIGVGNPEQLLLAHRFKALIPELTWIRTCGGLFDFLSGMRSRAPKALQAVGLEWAYRMALEPKRLGWRYATTNLTATIAMARDSHSPPALH
ncbi:MAG TPA: WecB/TagA/CpsF family glycosyltransferase [Rhizomicrobium sp.]|nr:WecB/TagA/CpsF family glycosyltransferase [Rhizomicrobium sp.]